MKKISQSVFNSKANKVSRQSYRDDLFVEEQAYVGDNGRLGIIAKDMDGEYFSAYYVNGKFTGGELFSTFSAARKWLEGHIS